MKYFAHVFMSLLMAFVLVACSSKLTNENLDKVKAGMSETEVKKILGNPEKVATSETLGIRGTSYYYKNGSKEVKILFLNNNVMAKEGSFQ